MPSQPFPKVEGYQPRNDLRNRGLAGRVEELDRLVEWTVELVFKMLLPSSFACPVELLPCAKSLHAPHVPYAPECSKRPISKDQTCICRFHQPLLHQAKISFCKEQDLQLSPSHNESFYEALDRFKEYIRDCPNHGFKEGNLWNIFYRGIDHKYKLSLDTASNGNFMTKTIDEAKVLIENLAASDCNNCPDYDRSSRTTTSSPDVSQMAELKNMMAQVLKGQLKHINAIEGMSDANEDPSRDAWEISLMN
ncbi:unnamed protein product [Microthlaspi erraticum]|uniref:Retrotransposon gag domain-containing protein n=1 Tax=Microthlaspi erraticum TaxID=1685480 RepID=A0A6D2ISN3_9BRAS|nr:unnamed protein product [Microthlaspi erraticum]